MPPCYCDVYFGEHVKERSGPQPYVPPDPKDDKALQRAIELLHARR